MSAKATAAAIPPAHQAQQEPEQHAQAVKKKTGTDAGFAVLPYGGTTEVWQRLLFTGIPPAGATELFSLLNGPDERYKAGSIMLLVDLINRTTSRSPICKLLRREWMLPRTTDG